MDLIKSVETNRLQQPEQSQLPIRGQLASGHHLVVRDGKLGTEKKTLKAAIISFFSSLFFSRSNPYDKVSISHAISTRLGLKSPKDVHVSRIYDVFVKGAVLESHVEIGLNALDIAAATEGKRSVTDQVVRKARSLLAESGKEIHYLNSILHKFKGEERIALKAYLGAATAFVNEARSYHTNPSAFADFVKNSAITKVFPPAESTKGITSRIEQLTELGQALGQLGDRIDGKTQDKFQRVVATSYVNYSSGKQVVRATDEAVYILLNRLTKPVEEFSPPRRNIESSGNYRISRLHFNYLNGGDYSSRRGD